VIDTVLGRVVLQANLLLFGGRERTLLMRLAELTCSRISMLQFCCVIWPAFLQV